MRINQFKIRFFSEPTTVATPVYVCVKKLRNNIIRSRKRSKSDVLTVHETYLSPYEENTSTVDGMKFEVDWSHIIDIVTQFL